MLCQGNSELKKLNLPLTRAATSTLHMHRCFVKKLVLSCAFFTCSQHGDGGGAIMASHERQISSISWQIPTWGKTDRFETQSRAWTEPTYGGQLPEQHCAIGLGAQMFNEINNTPESMPNALRSHHWLAFRKCAF
jgi:hypothetical protein